MNQRCLHRWHLQGQLLMQGHVGLCRRMTVKNRDNATVAKFRAKLSDHAAKIGGVFVHYDPETATWIMKVDHF